ncbi:hypothetical protein [Candidatus Palauibacter sp.]|uniref:hypothetical protein n=1 Tax=Candidatus Palauibacter sp. TaxID=3101350 RepID=UPI003CC5D051
MSAAALDPTVFRTGFKQLVAVKGGAIRGEKWELLREAYWEYLRGRVSDEAFTAGAAVAIAEADRLPKPKALLELCPRPATTTDGGLRFGLNEPDLRDPHGIPWFVVDCASEEGRAWADHFRRGRVEFRDPPEGTKPDFERDARGVACWPGTIASGGAGIPRTHRRITGAPGGDIVSPDIPRGLR